jgi:hypothetical protein
MSAMKQALDTRIEHAAQGYARAARAAGIFDITEGDAADVLHPFVTDHLDAFAVYLDLMEHPMDRRVDPADMFGVDIFRTRQGEPFFLKRMLGRYGIELADAAKALGPVTK